MKNNDGDVVRENTHCGNVGEVEKAAEVER